MRSSVYQEFAHWTSTGALHLNGWLMLSSPSVAEILAGSSFDSITIDMQHGQASVADMMPAIAIVASAGKPTIVRVPVGDFSLCSRALDAGARGVICPMIQTASDARALVQATKFPPLGRRSWGAPRALTMSQLSTSDFLQVENTSNFIFAMIETTEALENLADILNIEGIDGVYVGPNDLCISLTDGREVDADHRTVKQVCKELAQTVQRHGKLAGIYANTPELASEYVDYGFSFISIGSDIAFLKAQAENAVGYVRKGIVRAVESNSSY